MSGYSFIRTENDEEDNQDKRYPKSLVKENGSTSKARYASLNSSCSLLTIDSFTMTEKHEIVYTFATTKEENPMATFCFKYRTIGKFAKLTAEVRSDDTQKHFKIDKSSKHHSSSIQEKLSSLKMTWMLQPRTRDLR